MPEIGNEKPAEAVVKIPEKARGRLTVENKKAEREKGYEWHEGLFEGRKCWIGIGEYEVDEEVKGSATRFTVVDFRGNRAEDKTGPETLVVSCPGFPGVDRSDKVAFADGDLNKVKNGVEYGALRRAAREDGLLVIPQLKHFPRLASEAPSFLADGRVIRRGIADLGPELKKQFGEKRGLNLTETKNIFMGYSNGAGEAGALAELVENELTQAKSATKGNELWLTSLTAIVPLSDLISDFTKEAWTITKTELATRYEAVTGKVINPFEPGKENENTRRLFEEVVKLLVIPGQREKVIAEIGNAAEQGSLGMVLAIADRIRSDPLGFLSHRLKYERTGLETARNLGERWTVKLSLGANDSIFGIHTAAEITSTLVQSGEVPPETKLFRGESVRLENGKWWAALFPNAGGVMVNIVGENDEVGTPWSGHLGAVQFEDRFFIDDSKFPLRLRREGGQEIWEGSAV